MSEETTPSNEPAEAEALPPLRAALEAVLLVVDEPVAEWSSPRSWSGRRRRWRVSCGTLAAEYDARRARLRAAAGVRGLAALHPGRLRARSSSGSCATASRPG